MGCLSRTISLINNKFYKLSHNVTKYGHPLFFRLLSNAFSDFGSVGRKKKKNCKNKIGKESGARRPGTSA